MPWPDGSYWDHLKAYMVLEKSGNESERGTGRVFVGTEVLSIPQDTVESLRQYFQPNADSFWPGLFDPASGSREPAIDDYIMEREQPGRPGWSRITLYYRKPEWLAGLDTALKCILYVDISGVATKIKLVGDQTVEGPEQNPENADDYLTEWVVIKGNNERLQPRMTIKLTVAYDAVPFQVLYNTVGKYHIYTASFGGAFIPAIAAKKLMYIGSKIATDTNRHGKWLADHFFLTSDIAYDVDVTTEAFIKRVIEVDVKKLGVFGFEATNKKSRIIGLQPLDETVEVDIHKGGADFGDPDDGILTGLVYLNVS